MTTGPTDIPVPNLDELRSRAEETLKNPPPEVGEAVDTAKHFYKRNKPLILTVAGCYVLYRIEKRMVRKVVTKVIKNTPVRLDVAQYNIDADAYDKIKYAAAEAAWAAKNR